MTSTALTIPHRQDWTLESLIDFLNLQHQADLHAQDIRHEASETAVHNALVLNDKRLDGMNAFREALADATNNNLTRAEFDAAIGPMREKIDSIGKPNWVLLIGGISTLIAVMSGIWLLIGMQITVATTPQAIAIEQVKIVNKAHTDLFADIAERLRRQDLALSREEVTDAEATTDRNQANARLTRLETEASAATSDRRTNEARINARLLEIQSQFCSSDSIRNLMHANDLRLIGILWQRQSHDVLPINNVFYPTVCVTDTRP